LSIAEVITGLRLRSDKINGLDSGAVPDASTINTLEYIMKRFFDVLDNIVGLLVILTLFGYITFLASVFMMGAK
jgi:lipopolysaccharide/colanic/teichoic acid biosynthesis glycosyltransferase